jgi:hypothetical protein
MDGAASHSWGNYCVAGEHIHIVILFPSATCPPQIPHDLTKVQNQATRDLHCLFNFNKYPADTSDLPTWLPLQ